jgi:hypothetical protein
MLTQASAGLEGLMATPLIQVMPRKFARLKAGRLPVMSPHVAAASVALVLRNTFPNLLPVITVLV